MKMGTDMCNLFRLSYDKRSYYKKYPTLTELYLHLFHNVASLPKHLHNSLVDSLICLQCFLFIENIIPDKHEIVAILSPHFLR